LLEPNVYKSPFVVRGEEPVPQPVQVPLTVRFVNVPTFGVPEPIGPGAAKVAPFKLEAFRFGTFVVDATVNGAVPVATEEV
jgi:hypothetical protein